MTDDRENTFRDILEARNYSPRTVDNYTRIVHEFRQRCKIIPGEHTPVEYVREYILFLQRFKRLDPASINLTLAAIRLYFQEVVKTKIEIKDLPYLKTAKKLPEIFSQEEIRAILAAPMNSKHRLFLMFSYGCGLRVHEAVKIRVKDMNLDRHILYIRGKGNKDRIVSIAEIPIDLLNTHLYGKDGQDWLFESQTRPGEHISKRTAGKILEHACEKAGVKSRHNPHKLRHSFSVHCIEQGTDCRFIQKILGHSNIKTTMEYLNVSTDSVMKIRSPLSKVI